MIIKNLTRHIYFCSLLVMAAMTLGACGGNGDEQTSDAHRQHIDSTVNAIKDVDGLRHLVQEYQKTEDKYGLMKAYGALGNALRSNSLYVDAIEMHNKGLRYAEDLDDTLDIINGMNAIATCNRRLGIMEDAANYHYRALYFCDLYSKKNDEEAKKLRLKTLNGIGNTMMTIKNYELADSLFQLALQGTVEAKDTLGMAINCANLGSLNLQMGKLSAAEDYYNRSMAYNRKVKSELGIALSNINLGNLYEKRGNKDKAIKEYTIAYNSIVGGTDKWHWLEACIALTRLYIERGNMGEAKNILDVATKTAKEMNSIEYVSRIYELEYLYYKAQGQYKQALDSYTLSRMYQDSVANIQNISHIQNVRIRKLRDTERSQLAEVEKTLNDERATKNRVLIVLIMLLFFSGVTVSFLWYAIRMRQHNIDSHKEMEKMRTNFFTNITHEFRTPLTVIIGLVREVNKKITNNKEISRELSAVERQGESLLELINQLLDTARMLTHTDKTQWYHGDIVAFMRMAQDSYQEYARSRGVTLLFTSNESVIEMDFVAAYFFRILRNLLSNSFKYTKRNGNITISLETKADVFTMKLSDNGKSISDDDLPHVFEPFYSGKMADSTISSGIGLPYVKQMVDSMRGKCMVENNSEGGVTFTIMMPLKNEEVQTLDISELNASNIPGTEKISTEKVELVDDAIEEDDDNGQRIRKPQVLVIEDNPDISLYISSILKEMYRVYYASDGNEGLEKARDIMPDVILTDLMMPNMDGFELCKAIRDDEVLNHIPIIVVSARNDRDEYIKTLKYGADSYIIKPFRSDELLVNIQNQLEKSRNIRERFTTAIQQGNKMTVDLKHADREFVNKITDVIAQNINNYDLSVDMVAQKMFMSRSQLSRKVKAVTGYTIINFIMHMRMDKAKRLLASSEMPITEVAMKCGFEDSSYFTRVFKQTYDITPTQYRKSPIK